MSCYVDFRSTQKTRWPCLGYKHSNRSTLLGIHLSTGRSALDSSEGNFPSFHMIHKTSLSGLVFLCTISSYVSRHVYNVLLKHPSSAAGSKLIVGSIENVWDVGPATGWIGGLAVRNHAQNHCHFQRVDNPFPFVCGIAPRNHRNVRCGPCCFIQSNRVWLAIMARNITASLR